MVVVGVVGWVALVAVFDSGCGEGREGGCARVGGTAWVGGVSLGVQWGSFGGGRRRRTGCLRAWRGRKAGEGG